MLSQQTLRITTFGSFVPHYQFLDTVSPIHPSLSNSSSFSSSFSSLTSFHPFPGTFIEAFSTPTDFIRVSEALRPDLDEALLKFPPYKAFWCLLVLD